MAALRHIRIDVNSSRGRRLCTSTAWLAAPPIRLQSSPLVRSRTAVLDKSLGTTGKKPEGVRKERQRVLEGYAKARRWS